jgi:hypothetical protein
MLVANGITVYTVAAKVAPAAGCNCVNCTLCTVYQLFVDYVGFKNTPSKHKLFLNFIYGLYFAEYEPVNKIGKDIFCLYGVLVPFSSIKSFTFRFINGLLLPPQSYRY